MDVAQINGAALAYRHRQGLGRTVVFANALGADQSIWDDVIAALPGGYGVVTYDLRGHGQSAGVADGVEGLADDVSQLIDHLGLTNVLFVGVSVGGMIGQVLASRRGDVVKAAVLCNTASKIGTADRWAARVDAVQKGGVARVAADIVHTWFGADYAAQTDRLALHQTMVSRVSDDGYIAACHAIRDADLQTAAQQISLPVLCVAGAQDRSVPAAEVDGLARSIPGAELVVLDGVGHLPCLEAPQELAARIAAFDPLETDLATAGMAIRRAVLGDAHVDRAGAKAGPLDAAFQSLITTGAWGQVWAGLGVSARERSMITLALLAATGNFDEIPMHIRATRRTGASERDITEAFQHVAIYAGVPRANHALKLAKSTLCEMAKDD